MLFFSVSESAADFNAGSVSAILFFSFLISSCGSGSAASASLLSSSFIFCSIESLLSLNSSRV